MMDSVQLFGVVCVLASRRLDAVVPCLRPTSTVGVRLRIPEALEVVEHVGVIGMMCDLGLIT